MPRYVLEIVVEGKDRASGALSRVGSSLGRMSEIAGGMIMARGIEAVASLGAELAKMPGRAAEIEGISNAFAGITEQIEGGSTKMLAALEAGSLGMVNQTELMKQFNSAAGLVSVDFAQRLPDAFGHLAKVAAATGEDMTFMIDSLTRGVGRLSPMILDNLQIQVDLNSAYEAYGKEIGKAASELSKQEQQTALMAQAMDKLAENTAKMPEVAGSATQKMAALGVKFTNLKDRISMALLPIFTKLLDVVLKLTDKILPPLIDLFENKLVPAITEHVVPALEEAWRWLGEQIPKAMQAVRDVWSSVLEPVFNALWQFITDYLIPALSTLWAWLGTNIPEAFRAIKQWWDTTGKLVFLAIRDAVALVIETFVQFIELAESVIQRSGDISKALTPWGFADLVMDALGEVVGGGNSNQNIYGGVTVNAPGNSEELFTELQGLMP